jgi:DNA-binding CsgD family transcriptional regulator
MRASLPATRSARPRIAPGAPLASSAQPWAAPELRSAVVTVLDELGIAACVYGPQGRELHRSTRMREIVASTPDAADLLAAMRALARNGMRTLARNGSTSFDPSSDASRGDARDRDDAGREFPLRSVVLPPGAVGPGPVIVVELEPSRPALPRIDELVARCGLTHREAEVALLLALGGSDREIARRLERSPHTVRKHIEHIFDKLRLHSRKALMLRLSRATWASSERDEE